MHADLSDGRTLGRSSVPVTELSFGAAGIGNLYAPVTEAAAHAAVNAAWEAGIRYFDTAPHYGLGLSEQRLGSALRQRPRDSYTLSTKVGRVLEPVERPAGDDLTNGFAVPATHRRRWDFSADGVRRSLAESLRRLDIDRIDIVYLHDPDDHAEQALDAAYPALEELRSEGVIGAIGIGMNRAELPARFVRETDIDVVLLAGRYTLLDQEGLDELLPVAQARGVSVVVGGVFNSGLLADPQRAPTYDYGAVPEDVLTRTLRMQVLCAEHGATLRAAALQFPTGHPAVSSVLIGARTADEVRDAVKQARAIVPAELWHRFRSAGLLEESVPVPEGTASRGMFARHLSCCHASSQAASKAAAIAR
ncbi:aldo/keto reductase [Actinospica robiniae]|uniref:aldo/keto reductase n=1 Tax=Actinospica robiniae TaxID=304901 RepID=UPI000A05D0FE